jgi:hypothetical protein
MTNEEYQEPQSEDNGKSLEPLLSPDEEEEDDGIDQFEDDDDEDEAEGEPEKAEAESLAYRGAH